MHSRLLLFGLFLISLNSCNLFGDDLVGGCTICSATNYDEEADFYDGTCEFPYEDLIGDYQMSDWRIDSAGNETRSEYSIGLYYDECRQDRFVVHNYANLSNNATDEPIGLKMKLDDDSLAIIIQSYYSVDNGIITDYSFERSMAYKKGDSLFVPFNYKTAADSVYGFARGVKI